MSISKETKKCVRLNEIFTIKSYETEESDDHNKYTYDYDEEYFELVNDYYVEADPKRGNCHSLANSAGRVFTFMTKKLGTGNISITTTTKSYGDPIVRTTVHPYFVRKEDKPVLEILPDTVTKTETTTIINDGEPKHTISLSVNKNVSVNGTEMTGRLLKRYFEDDWDYNYDYGERIFSEAGLMNYGHSTEEFEKFSEIIETFALNIPEDTFEYIKE